MIGYINWIKNINDGLKLIFLKGYCVLVRVEIIHKSNFDLCIISTRTKTQ